MIKTVTVGHGDPRDWDEMPDGYGALIATELEDRGWHVTDHDDTVVNVIAADGTETGVWFTHGKCWTGRSENGRCNNPVDILADVTDPEQIAGRADAVMRELGLKPGKLPVAAQVDNGLPHDEYMAAVADALEADGYKPAAWWTETPDGRQLDGVFKFADPRFDGEWPEGVFLGWDQYRGWGLGGEGASRNVIPLAVGVFGHPACVAFVAGRALRGQLATPEDDAWDGAAGLLARIEAWEAEG